VDVEQIPGGSAVEHTVQGATGGDELETDVRAAGATSQWVEADLTGRAEYPDLVLPERCRRPITRASWVWPPIPAPTPPIHLELSDGSSTPRQDDRDPGH
jgi:hypothetical protein